MCLFSTACVCGQAHEKLLAFMRSESLILLFGAYCSFKKIYPYASYLGLFCWWQQFNLGKIDS